ncbi:acyl carrier protein, partial [Stigmatella aurantiaca]
MTSPAAGKLIGWIAEDLGAQLEIDPRMIDVHERFSRYGLDSLGAIALVRKLAQRLDRPVSPVAVWRFPTPHALAEHLCGNTSADAPSEAEEAPQGPSGSPDEPIAIVGMACRFPGAPSLA